MYSDEKELLFYDLFIKSLIENCSYLNLIVTFSTFCILNN